MTRFKSNANRTRFKSNVDCTIIYLKGFVPFGNTGLLQYARTDFHAALGSAPHGNPLSYKCVSGLGNTLHFRLFGFDCILHPFHISVPIDSVTLGIDGHDLHSIIDFEPAGLFLLCAAGRLLTVESALDFLAVSITALVRAIILSMVSSPSSPSMSVSPSYPPPSISPDPLPIVGGVRLAVGLPFSIASQLPSVLDRFDGVHKSICRLSDVCRRCISSSSILIDCEAIS